MVQTKQRQFAGSRRKWYEEGAKKYGDRNWEKGLSVRDCINRMVRHSHKAANGLTDEDHLSAVVKCSSGNNYDETSSGLQRSSMVVKRRIGGTLT